MINEIKRDAKKRMEKSVEALKSDLQKTRAGRANASLLEHVTVPAYGSATPLNQLANISVQDARTLAVTTWDKSLTPAIEKAILSAGLGLNPVSAGDVIRVPLPPLTEERRKELVRGIKEEGESARVSIRNIRRDANNAIKELLKEKEISADEERGGQNQIQKITDEYIKIVDEVISNKEADLMEV